MARKKPWIAAILNFLLPGLGYIYNGKRVFLGALIFTADMLLNFYYLLNPVNELTNDTLVFSAAFFLITIAISYDAYKEAKTRRRRE